MERELNDSGFVCVRSVLDAETIAAARSELSALFADPSSTRPGDIVEHARLGSIRFDVVNRFPQLARLFLRPRLVEALRLLLGESFVLVPESAAHASGYGEWHKDTTSQERAGLLFHRAPEFRMLQVA